ncbi:MAG TPA: amidohydrolase family protein, partial [Thermoleophilia bacterium]|nr:amidohydrolase family protein [Thermoleophilia bacterium]
GFANLVAERAREFAEKQRGSIAKGKQADFIVVNRDYMKCPAADLWKMYAKATVVNGKTVYRMKGFRLF